MRTMNICSAVAATILACSAATSAEVSKQNAPATAPVKAAPLTMERFEGNAISTQLGGGTTLNGKSKLKREWFVVTDPAAPAKVNEGSGIYVVYESSPSAYKYYASYSAAAIEPTAAIEVRAQLFDVFGRHIRTLSSTEIADRDVGSFGQDGKWRLYSDNEASEMYTSVMYVASVRTATGKVYTINNQALLDQLRKVTSKITEAELEPTKSPLK